jgi:NADPH2:quinone reductase
MKAAHVVRLEGPSGIELVDVPEPGRTDGQARIRVHAAGLSFPDLLMSRGEYQFKPELPFAVGVDVAGELIDDAPSQGLAAGTRVVAAISHGGAAEIVAVPEDRLFPLPDSLPAPEAAGMPLTFLTAHFALGTRARVRAGEWVQVNGAAGGVGSAAVQVAKAMGCRVVALVASDGEADFVEQFHPDAVLREPTAAGVRDATDSHGVDAILDVVGTDEIVLEGLRALAPEGRLLTIGYVGGEIPSVRLNRLLLNNIDVRGVAWGPYTRANPGFAQSQWREVMQWYEAGRIVPSPATVRPLAEAADALRDIAERRVRGKVVLAVAEV